MIFERQEEDRDLQVALAERQTRALLGALGVTNANEWELVPRPVAAIDRLPDMDTVMGMFGGPGAGAEFDPSEIPGLSEYFAEKGAA